MNIVLIGYRSAGKSTVGSRLATHLGMEFVDTDNLIEQRCQRSISEIVALQGWDHFRTLEKRTIEDISRQDRLVIAPGGGAVLDVNNVMALRKRGLIVWLKARPEVLFRRMSEDPQTASRRPPLTGKGGLEEIREVLAHRNPFYQWASETELDTSELDVEAAVESILLIYQERIKGA